VPERLDVPHNLVVPKDEYIRQYVKYNTTFTGPDNASAANSTVVSPAASKVVKELGPNTAKVLFADVPGPNGFVIHVIDKVLLPSSQFLNEMFGPQSDFVANLTAAAAAGPDCVGSAGAGRCDATFYNIVFKESFAGSGLLPAKLYTSFGP
jgi:hypothetical protein